MPIDLPANINKEKNKLSSDGAWLWLLDVDIDGVDETFYYVNNNENFVYGGNTYIKCAFELGDFKNSDTGRLPSRDLDITHPEIVEFLLPYIEDYNGLVGASIVATPVNSKFPDLDYSSKAQEFEVISSKLITAGIRFNLGSGNPLNKRLQKDKYFGQMCRYVSNFKGVECGYSGGDTSCSGTRVDCKSKSNESRYGGSPGLRSKAVRFV